MLLTRVVEKAGQLARTEALPRLAVLLAARMAEVGPIARVELLAVRAPLVVFSLG